MEKNKIAQPKLTRHEAVDRLLTQLPTMDREALLKLWQDLFGRTPGPDLYRTTLIPILAYRLQEKAYGGLKESTLKRLQELAKDHANGKRSVVRPMIRPKIGTRYVREYGGKLHEVTVLETGYEYQGQVHRSLTEVAKVISGTKWSGPRFFGYTARKESASMNPRTRCAIYTRKSSEEGLEQAFNSLDAQREACEAYVKSQQHEGWQAIGTHYDDGGFSGGNVDRPALKRLMDDIHAGKVSIVVVYKVDRLTRSLADFAKLVEQFDKFNVSFVSVTQQFNTTSSMGRLTLNVLLSFAQFEREVTGERIRDKVAASKKKGMWMGGTIPLGYNVCDRVLQINEAEATTVRTIFNQFLQLGNVTVLRDWLHENDIRSKAGGHFFRGPLYEMLHNPLYIGLTRHKTETYPGQHQAILDRETWEKVQALLVANRQGGKRKARATKASLFTGLIFDAEGTRYTPTHATKNGRRYRYYTSQAIIKKTKKIETPTRIPAPDLESAVIERLLKLLREPGDLVTSIRDDFQQGAGLPGDLFARIVARATSTAATWQTLSGTEREHFLQAVIDRVIIHPTRVEIRIRVPQFIQQLLGDNAPTADKRGGNTTAPPQDHLQLVTSIECPFRHISQGRALRLIVGNTNITTDASRQAILKAIARARLWYEQLTTGEASGISELADMHGLSQRFLHAQMKLVQLSPQSIENLMNGTGSLPLSLADLLKVIPLNWREQAFNLPTKSA